MYFTHVYEILEFVQIFTSNTVFCLGKHVLFITFFPDSELYIITSNQIPYSKPVYKKKKIICTRIPVPVYTCSGTIHAGAHAACVTGPGDENCRRKLPPPPHHSGRPHHIERYGG